MKYPDRTTVSRLEDLPNIGRATAADLERLGVGHPRQLIGRNALRLFQDLEALSGQRQDPCVLDVFMAAVDFMEGGDPRPWWRFTAERKRRYGRILAARSAIPQPAPGG